jgi:ENTH domain
MKKAVRSVYVLQTSSIMRLLTVVHRKNVTKGYSEAQIKVRKATSNDAWGPEGADMADIAKMTFDRYT